MHDKVTQKPVRVHIKMIPNEIPSVGCNAIVRLAKLKGGGWGATWQHL